MPPATLVVDFGAHATGAAVVVGDQATLVRDPLTSAAVWPSQLSLDANAFYAGSAAERIRLANPRNAVEGPRRAVDTETLISLGERDLAPTAALSAFLGSIRAEASRIVPYRVDRLMLTVPTAYQLPDRRRDLLIAAGEEAGFPEVELVASAVATVLDAQSAIPFRDGSLVMVCDLGETWSTALLRINRDEVVPIAQESANSGRDLDALLLADLRAQAGDWLEPRLALPGDDGLRVRQQAADFVRQIKHALATLDDGAEVTGRLAGDAPPYRLSREWLDRLAEPGLRWIGASCRSMLARASAGSGGLALAGSTLSAAMSQGPGAPGPALPGATLADIDAVILTGGHSRLACAERILREELQRPVVRLNDPDLAAVRGSVRFAVAAPMRRITADHPKWRIEPLSWDVPTGRARLERWSVGAGEAYQRGAVLAHLRTVDERVYELTVPEEGMLLSRRGRVGDVVGPTLIAAAKRPASLLAGDPPGKRQELTGSGEWLFTPDRRMLVECTATAKHVRLWSIPDGVLLGEFSPEFDSAQPRRGRVFVQPGGRLALVTWDPAGSFAVWDVRTGQCTTTFRDSHSPSNVAVNEREWRLSTEGEDGGAAGRYRRSVATVWDLRTGRKLEKLTDDWQRRLSGYRDRSASDCFGDDAFSPDGRLRAVPVLSQAGPTGISLQEATSENEVFRAEHAPSARVRVAFSADGQFLLANRESPQRSHVDVWEL
jgi:molecular chaperone DnaK